MKKVSIIICTYNPEQEVFERCLKSIISLIHPLGVEIKCTIIDNNSKVSVAELDYVKTIIENHKWITIVEENTPGLSYARAKGIVISKGDWMIFFDDDNEPDSHYVTEIVNATVAYPEVGLWGAGQINVIYMAPVVDEWFLTHKEVFQDHHFKTVLVGNREESKDFYPPGTGMSFRREVAEKWLFNFKNEVYTNVGRRAGSMESSEDIQIIHTTFDLGYKIGNWPGLSINHLTSANKTTFAYMRRLFFGIALGIPKTEIELARQKGNTSQNVQIPSTYTLIFKLLKFKVRQRMVPKHERIDMLHAYIYFFGGVVGKYRMMKRNIPHFLKKFILDYQLEKTE